MPKKVAIKKTAVKKIAKKPVVVAKKAVKAKKVSKKVPQLKMRGGKKIPAIGLGTFGSDHMSNENIALAVKSAIKNGYRLIDCAKVYCNEDHVGKALQEVVADGTVKRKDLIIISKLANQDHGDVETACR